MSLRGAMSRLLSWGGGTRPIVGLYALPRGGSNFVSAALHYHPHVFCVSEREHDWRMPLGAWFERRSIFRRHGVQRKRRADIRRVVFNKVQRFERLWGPDTRFPPSARFLFYLRNPIRVLHSREAYRAKHEPERSAWSDTLENFYALLGEARHLLNVYDRLRERFPCRLWMHECFCRDYATAARSTHAFLGVEPSDALDPRRFFRACGDCGAVFVENPEGGQAWLWCPRCDEPVRGYGLFNPLREVDVEDVTSDRWKQHPQINRLMHAMKQGLGLALADYYWAGDFSQNLFDQAPARAA